MNTSFVTDDLAVGGEDAAEEMFLKGWIPVCVGDNARPYNADLHYPLLDGRGNPTVVIGAAINCILSFWKAERKVFVYCRHGMNRSALIAAAALAVSGRCEWLSTALIKIARVRDISTPRDDTMAEVLQVVMLLRPCKPNHA